MTATVVVFGTSQLDPGWSAGAPTPALEPAPIATPTVAPESEVVRHDLMTKARRRVIAGHLVSPQGGSDTAVVLVAGAGPSARTQLLGEADALASRGLHAVTYDKAREGYSWRHRDYAALAEDLQAVVADTRARTGAVRVGVMAFSEGSWVAARAAAAPASVEFLILVLAPIVSPLEQAAWVADRRIVGLPDAVRRVPASLLTAGRGILPYLEEDARPHLAASALPILGVWGAEDSTVPVGTAVGRLIASTPQPVTVRVLAGARHQLEPRSGWADHVAVWARSPQIPATDDVRGVEPGSAHSVPDLPRGAWFTSPLLALSCATLAAVTTVVIRRRRLPTKESTHVRS